MNRVVKILMDRDDLTKEEAEAEIAECREVLLTEEDDSVIEDMLGLEPDYLEDILGF